MSGIGKKETRLEAGHAFKMRLVDDIFRKMRNEMRRFEEAEFNGKGRADQVDAAINFAITAWHVSDWVWGQHKNALREYYRVNKKWKFQDKIRRECSDLAVCDVIANAAKHGGVADEKEGRPDVETILVARPVASAAGVELVAVQTDLQWSLEIEVDGKRKDPLELFNRVFSFWHKFIQKHCVAKQVNRGGQNEHAN